LSIEAYSALLIECKLVAANKKKDGSRVVKVCRDQWYNFLSDNNLRGDIHGRGGVAELANGRINTAVIQRMAEEAELEESTSSKKTMWMLRLGKVNKDEGPPSNTALNHGMDPPRMNSSMRHAKSKLGAAVRHNLLMCFMDKTKMDNVHAVHDWVLMKATTRTTTTTTTATTAAPLATTAAAATPPTTTNTASINLTVSVKKRKFLDDVSPYNNVQITLTIPSQFPRHRHPSLELLLPFRQHFRFPIHQHHLLSHQPTPMTQQQM
jgi:hypothetical protein